MKNITAKFETTRLIRISGTGSHLPQYDDNAIRLVLKINHGPKNMLDRKLTTDVGVSELLQSLPIDTVINVYQELLDMKVDKMAEVKKRHDAKTEE